MAVRCQSREQRMEQLPRGAGEKRGAVKRPLTLALSPRRGERARVRGRKLLLHRDQIDRLIGAVERRGFTVVPTRMYWSRGRAKLAIGLAKGKRKQDKRATEKDRDWQRQKQRILKER